MEAQTYWNEGQLRQWLQLQRTPAKTLKLIRKQWGGRMWPQNPLDPFGDLSSFWQRQLFDSDEIAVKRLRVWLDASEKHFMVTRSCAGYPEPLKHISAAPILLFGCGEPELLQRPWLAVVGSRNASIPALEMTSELCSGLVKAGWGIVSGMARGIDTRAHTAALRTACLRGNGDTLAVLGAGIDQCYPKSSRPLYSEISQRGLILSEFAPGTSAKPEQFPRRNRIISGISQGVIVIEATLRSGSLITARLAAEQGRDVFAVPGAPQSPGAQGPNQLIQQGARLVTCARDILSELPELKEAEISAHDFPEPVENINRGLANPDLLANVGFRTTSLDTLVAAGNASVAEVVNQLMRLELDGWIKAVPGGYVRVRR